MEFPLLENRNSTEYFSEEKEIKDNETSPKSSYPNGDEEDDEPEEDNDYEETYGDLEDGHNDLNDQESDQGVANLE
ncbi:hypothetical protein [Desertivirga arenae]|uniref:hypothetical protein n=1 Tax=Desertivirga arenae TaxID=2810309 RepID=UPI001A95AD13|nr:hypothetical protein [Pedobacter sp. SYSU D00823]